MSDPAATRRRRPPPPTPSNSLILLLPSPYFFQPPLKDLFKLHFSYYGTMLSWSSLDNLERVLVVYSDEEGAKGAKEEMDGFVWEEEDATEDVEEEIGNRELDGQQKEARPQKSSSKTSLPPIRVYFGPSISPSLFSPSTSNSHLSVPSLTKNFLISPPGSPPVGWEQVLEDAPNKNVLHNDFEEGVMGKGGMEELQRALRFLSTGEGDEGQEEEEEGEKTIISSSTTTKPSVVISTPPNPTTPPTSKLDRGSITNVKATVESMLGLSDLDDEVRGGPKFVPTARPPTS